MKPVTLLSEYSPNGTHLAILESYFGSLYLYLINKQTNETKSVWVCNLSPAPDTFDEEAFKEGLPIPLPKDACDHPNGAPLPIAENLQFLWFMECNGVVIRESNTILAIIPPWSNQKQPGYAMACSVKTPAAIPLEDKNNNSLYQYLVKTNQFWKEWDDDHAWPTFLDTMTLRLESALGPYSRIVPIDNDCWPPKCIVETQYKNGLILNTIGMSILPQPNISHEMEDASYYQRIEIALGITYELSKEKDTYIHILQQISETPWTDNCWFADGHIAFVDGLPNLPSGIQCKGLLFTENPLLAPDIEFPLYLEEPINILWCIPITEDEIEIAKKESPAILKDLLVKHQVDWKFQDRESCIPSPKKKPKPITIKKLSQKKPSVDMDHIYKTLATLITQNLIVPVQQDTVIKTKAKKVTLKQALTYTIRVIKNTKDQTAIPIFTSEDLFNFSLPNKPLFVWMNGIDVLLLLLKKDVEILYLDFNTSKSQPIPIDMIQQFLNKG